MATKKKEAVVQAPVSEEANIEMQVFSQPQNGMLGFIVASDTVNGKWLRYAHCYLNEGGPDMSLDSKIGRKKVTYDDIERLNSILTLFANKVKEFYANR